MCFKRWEKWKAKALHIKTIKKNGAIVDCTRIRDPGSPENAGTEQPYTTRLRWKRSRFSSRNFEFRTTCWALNIRRSRPTSNSSELRSPAYRSVELWSMKWSGNDTIQDGIELEEKIMCREGLTGWTAGLFWVLRVGTWHIRILQCTDICVCCTVCHPSMYRWMNTSVPLLVIYARQQSQISSVYCLSYRRRRSYHLPCAAVSS